MIIGSLYYPNMIGGAEKVIKILCEELARTGHSVKVLCLAKENQDSFLINEVSVKPIKIENIYWPFDGAKRPLHKKMSWHILDSKNNKYKNNIQKEIEEYQPDIINTHNIAGFSTQIWSDIKTIQPTIPIVHTLHDQYLLCYRSTMFKKEKECTKRCTDCYLTSKRKIVNLKNIDHIVGVSKFILERHRKYIDIDTQKTCVIYNPTESNPEKKQISENTENFKFGFFGKINTSKGTYSLINTYNEFSKKYNNVELHLGGHYSDEDKQKFESLISKNKSIKYHGFVDKDEFLPSIDCLIVPSLWADTAPLVILEAFEHKLPVIGSTMGGIPELIKISGGSLFDINIFQEDLYAKMEFALSGKYQYNASIEDPSTYSVKGFAKNYLDLYKSLT